MDDRMYETYQEYEDKHWWFVARRKIFVHILSLVLDPNKTDRQILDIGCATGAMLDELQRYGKAIGIDSSKEMVDYVVKKGRKDVYFGELPNTISFKKGHFDIITLLDVVEHIDDDLLALRGVWQLLNDSGILLCSVPAYRFLWSYHDDINHHKRRYTRKELETKLVSAGFEIVRIAYFNTLLFFPILVTRLANKLRKNNRNSDFFLPPSRLNSLLAEIFAIERHLMTFVDFPCGTSILAVARK